MARHVRTMVIAVGVITAAASALLTLPSARAAVAAPTISSVSAAQGGIAGGTRITVQGANFSGVKSVLFGTVPGTSIKVASKTQLAVTAPAHAAGLVDIRVVGAHGTSPVVAADQYTYVGAPTITALSPSSGTTAGNDLIYVTGTGFISDSGYDEVTAVTFAGVPGTQLLVTSPTTLQVKTPAAAPGTVDVRVVTNFGTTAISSADQFTYVGILLSGIAASALGNVMFGDGAVDTVPVPADCTSAWLVSCTGGTPSDPPLYVTVDKAMRAGDAPRGGGNYLGNSQFDAIGNFRLKTLSPVPITLPGGGTCQLSIDTTAGANQSVRVDVIDSVVIDPVTGAGANGPTQVGSVTVSDLESTDYSLTGDLICAITSAVPLSTVDGIVANMLTPWITGLGTLCGGPAPAYFQACPAA